MDTFTEASPEALEEIAHEMNVRSTNEVFVFFPMGSQTEHLIFQAVAKLGVYVIVADPASVTAADISALKPNGIIISGGPASVDTEPPPFDTEIFGLGIPVFGICLGFQMWAKWFGLTVTSGRRQFAVHEATVEQHLLFDGLPSVMPVLQSHGDEVREAVEIRSDGFLPIAQCDGVLAGAAWKHLVGVQFHPEVTETEFGPGMFENFVFKICKAKDRFPAASIAKRKIDQIRTTVGDGKVLIALSGGCDSSVCAYLLKAANLGKGKIRAVYIRGIDRPDDEEYLLNYFGNQDWITVEIVDATDEFLEAFVGKRTMKEKRIAMRGVYKPILESKAAAFGASFICQGTLETDVSESGGHKKPGETDAIETGGRKKAGPRKAKIKQHHNTNLGLNLPELLPLVDCVKDGARDIGREIGVPEALLVRHPFPGPGLAVRNEDEITRERLVMSRAADGIWIEELRRADLYRTVWQAGAVVTQSVHTTTKGDEAGEGLVIALWAVWSVNGFTARAAELPFDFLRRVTRRICNEVPGVGAVVYRISDKPISTIEWG